jgi:hypothetical protein
MQAMSSTPNRMCASLLVAALLAALVTTTGCYRREVSRRGYTGFSIDSGAEPAPRAEQANFSGYRPPQMDEESDPLGDLFSPVTGLFRAIGQAFDAPDAQQGNYTAPRPDGVPHRPQPAASEENLSLFPPDDPVQGR